MTAPSSSPRGERAGTPGARWETELVWGGEQIVEDGASEPTANRAARRAARRARKGSDGHRTLPVGPTGPQEAREGLWAGLSRPNGPSPTPRPQGHENGPQSLNVAPPTRRSAE